MGEKVFDAIERVVHNKADRCQIVEIQSSIGSAKETVVLDKVVKCQGNIEDWLGKKVSVVFCHHAAARK